MKNNIFKVIIAVVVVGVLATPVFAFAQVPSTGGDSTGAGTSAPSTGGDSTGSGTSAPATGGDSTGSGTSVPSTGGDSTGAGVTTPTTGGDSTGSGTTPAPSPAGNNGSGPVGGGTNTSVGGSGSSGTSVSSGGSSGGGVTLPPLVSIGDCTYLGSFMKPGKVAVYADVLKLQQFLNTYEGALVPVTGLYDAATISAVNAFQVKYTADVLTPWGASTPTSQVYYTTSKKINEIFCQKTFSLTPAQLAEITAYRTGAQDRTVDMTQDVGIDTSAKPTPSSSTIAGTVDTHSTTSDSQVAAAAKSSVWSKIWNFVKRIFGR